MEMERLHQQAENVDVNGDAAPDGGGGNVRSNFPDQLRRRYEVYLTLPGAAKVAHMRAVTSHDLGRLVKIKARPAYSLHHLRICEQSSADMLACRGE